MKLESLEVEEENISNKNSSERYQVQNFEPEYDLTIND